MRVSVGGNFFQLRDGGNHGVYFGRGRRVAVQRDALEKNQIRRVSTDSPPDSKKALVLVTSGRPEARYQKLRIVDPKTGHPLGSDEIGEIWIAGDHVGQGYWRNPE